MGGGVSKRTKTVDGSKRLVLYSNFAAELPSFVEALRENADSVTSAQYSFSTATAETLKALIAKLVKQNGRFASAALCPLGPNRPPASPNEADFEDCKWELSERLVLTQASQLLRPDSPVRAVLEALGKAVVDDGRVDLLSCGLIGTWACPPTGYPTLMPFAPICEASSCRFSASRYMLLGNPIEAEDDWPMESDETIDARSTYFLPPAGYDATPEGALSSKFRVSALRKRYVLGEELGRGQFAMVRRAVRRQELRQDASAARLLQSSSSVQGDGRDGGQGGGAGGAWVGARGPSLQRSASSLLVRRSSGSVANGLRDADLQLSTAQALAVKAIDVSKVASLNEIEAEIEIMRMLRHPHIIRLFETFYSPKRIYLVLELAEGGELFDVIVERGRFGEADAATVTSQLCGALDHMHTLGVVHSDLKPSNLLLTSRSAEAQLNLKVTDFGLSSCVLGPTTHVANALVGTPDYMSPEAFRGEPQAPSLDMWAVGVILYVLLSGEPPFVGHEAGAAGLETLYHSIVNVEYDRCKGEAWAQVSESAKELIISLLDPDKTRRPAASEVLVHKWTHLASGGDNASLAVAVARLRRYNAHRRMQRVARSVIASRRMTHQALSLVLKTNKGVPVDTHNTKSHERPQRMQLAGMGQRVRTMITSPLVSPR